MITSYGYAVKKEGRFLGFDPKIGKKKFYKRPKFPVVYGRKIEQVIDNGHLGEVVKVKLTIEEVSNGND